MSFWQKFKLIRSSLWAFLEPFVKLFLSRAGKILAEVALAAVKDIAVSLGDQDGETKRKAAYDKILVDLQDRGINLGVSVINAAIEAAVQKIK